jgi:hypothetical protein
MSLTKLPLGRNNSVMTSLFPPRESLVVTSRLGTGGKIANLFYGVSFCFFSKWLSLVGVTCPALWVCNSSCFITLNSAVFSLLMRRWGNNGDIVMPLQYKALIYAYYCPVETVFDPSPIHRRKEPGSQDFSPVFYQIIFIFLINVT